MLLLRGYKTSFEAAHYIKGHPKCGKKHGHSYHLEVRMQGWSDQFLDFAKIKEDVEAILVQPNFDHTDLGNRSAEDIAMDIGKQLASKQYVGELELHETDKFSVKIQFGNPDISLQR
jgi:6-pyruvoyl-tetrahydropterin synthase